MKKVFSALIIVYGVIVHLAAQDIPMLDSPQGLISLGDEAYSKAQYAGAIDYYSRALQADDDNGELWLKLADSYRSIGKSELAAASFEKAEMIGAQFSTTAADDYAETLLTLGNRSKSEQLFEGVDKDVDRVQNRLISLNDYEQFFIDSLTYLVSELNINSDKSDFSPAFYRDELVFVSARGNRPPWEPLDKRSNERYLSLYQVNPSKNAEVATFDLPRSKFHDGPLTFFADGKKYFVTKNNSSPNSNTSFLKLFMVEGDDSQNESLKEMPFNGDSFSTGHPTTLDGSSVIFASNRPGGYGGSDLYISFYQSGQWSSPENLGDKINTTGDELFPFISKTRQLYFASDGHVGLGGLDIFKIDFDGRSRLLNLGYPVNSSYDDFSLIIDEAMNSGYFASNRQGGQGSDDIYAFTISSVSIVSKLIDDVTGKPVSGTFKVVDAESGEEIAFAQTEDGIQFDALKGRKYQIIGTPEKGNPIVYDLSTSAIEEDVAEAILTVKSYPIISVRLTEEATGEVFVRQLSFRHNESEFEGAKTSNDRHVFKSEGFGEYLVAGEDPGFQPFLIPFELDETIKDSILVDLTYRRTAKPSTGLDDLASKSELSLGDRVVVDIPLFDVNTANLSDQAKQGLDQILKLLRNGQSPSIEVIGHTDSRGASSYNQRLSLRRAVAVKDYFVANEYDPSTIDTVGRGETDLLNDCADGVDCTEKQHEANRRIEVLVK